MATGYSNIVSLNVTRGTKSCTGLPMPPRGILERVILTQTSGSNTNATINIYDRKGACYAGSDLNVAQSGIIDSIYNSSGSAGVETTQPHNLLPGDTFEVKNATETAYNTTFTVVSVVNEYQVITDVSYTNPESTGALWQTTPFNPTTAPITHLVYTANKTGGTDFTAFDINRAYENKDNQSPTMRTRTSSLWLEIVTAGGATALTYEIAYTCRADDPI